MITRRGFIKGAAALGFAGCAKAASGRHIVVYNWPYYMSPLALREFEKKYAIRVVHELYQSGTDHELPTSLAATDQVDVVVPSQEILEMLILKNLLRPLDKDRLPNLKNILTPYLDQYFDRGNRYSVPYLWGTTGLGVNLGKVRNMEPTWQLLWHPAMTGRISLLASPSEVMAALLKMMGKSVNGASLADVVKAGAFLVEHRSQRPEFLDTPLGDLTSGKIWVAQSYSGDALQARKVERTIGYVLPREGALWWIDSLCIPTKAPHPEEAHLFINFLLDGEISALLSNDLWHPNPNGASFKYTRAEVLKDRSVYPPKDLLAKCELKRPEPSVIEAFLEYWAKLKK